MSKILIIEDEESIRRVLNKVLIQDDKSYSITEAVDGLDGISKINSSKYDLILCDIKMPKMDGIQFMKKVKNHDPAIPVFLVSGALLTESQSNALETKADGYLRKPFDIDNLHAFIDRGVQLRQHYKDLLEIVGDNKKFLELIQGKRQLKFLKDDEKRKQAQEILEQLQAC